MAQGGVSGIGVKVGYNLSASSPTGFTTISNLLAIEVPRLIANKIDKTVHGESRVKRSMPGLIEVTDLTLTILQDLDSATSADQAALYTLALNGNKIGVRIEFAVNTGLTSWVPVTFQGYVSAWQPGSNKEDKQELIVSIFFDDTTLTVGAAAASILA